jgi:hypothetical protein
MRPHCQLTMLHFNFRSPPFPYVDIGPRTPANYAVFQLSISTLALFGLLTEDVAFQFLGLYWQIVAFPRSQDDPIWHVSSLESPCLISPATSTLPNDHTPLPKIVLGSPEIHEAYPTPKPEVSCPRSASTTHLSIIFLFQTIDSLPNDFDDHRQKTRRLWLRTKVLQAPAKDLGIWQCN